MSGLLYLESGKSGLAAMATALTRRLVPTEVVVTGASLAPAELPPAMLSVLAENGIDAANEQVADLEQVNLQEIDLIVALDGPAAGRCRQLPGAPVVLRWQLDEPAPPEDGCDNSDAYRQLRDALQQRIEDFFLGGYLATMLSLKTHTETILDHFSDGIVVHDTGRNITYFNRAAERITGYDRRNVIGRDCWDVFPQGFCKERCNFKEPGRRIDRVAYPLRIKTCDGREKRVEMSVVAMHNEEGLCQGVLATFKDVTEVTQLRRHLRKVQSFHGIIGASEQMQGIYELVHDLAASDCPVLVQGESGTGKELVANAIHGESDRAGKPFVTVNCGALPEGILESELFGHVRGAFTGAVRDKKGRFELADGGTIFLDEVAELTPPMQVKLLRVLQEGIFERVGGEQPVRVDVRVISATNKDLRTMVHKETFREDLFYRLCVVPVTLPPLRDRRNDIPLLIEHFVQRFNKDLQREVAGVGADALQALIDYRWPGNIRELRNAIQYAFVKCKAGLIETEHLPPEIGEHIAARAAVRYRRRGKLNAVRVTEALKQAGGNKVKAAKLLKVGRATLYRFLHEHPIA